MKNRIPKEMRIAKNSKQFKQMKRGEFKQHVYSYKDDDKKKESKDQDLEGKINKVKFWTAGIDPNKFSFGFKGLLMIFMVKIWKRYSKI